VLLLNGRINNLEYGSNAPGAPDVFIDNNQLQHLWAEPNPCYLFAEGPAVPRLSALLGTGRLQVIAASGGKYLLAKRSQQLRH
jgi:hypothetical protein